LNPLAWQGTSLGVAVDIPASSGLEALSNRKWLPDGFE
jgi:hypothetical protein